MVQLARVEQSVLAECEEIIERGLDGFIEVGNALLRIRNERLYRVQFDTFELYCSLKWGMSDRHARRMIDAAEVAGNLSDSKSTKISDQLVPFSESQVRPLVALPPPVQRQAWQAAVDSSKNGKPTAKEVKAAVITLVPEVRKKAVTVRTDGTIKNSPVLRELKRFWKQATAPEREMFRTWIGAHP